MKQYKIIITFLISLFVFSTYISAQYENSNFGIAFNYSYTTSSKLFLFPNAQDPILRNQNIEMDGVNSYGVDIRYRISEPLIVGLSAEYLKNTKNHGEFSVGGFIIPIDDGFELIPVELTLYYVVPFSTEKFKFYMGGGAGIYFGRHIRNFSDVSVSDIGSETAYGIQVATGMDYIANEFISLRAEMRFRDPEFDMKSKYSKQIFEYQGRSLLLSRETFQTKANVDGVTFLIGVVFRLL